MQDLLLLIFWMMTLKRRRVQCSMTRTQEHTILKVGKFQQIQWLECTIYLMALKTLSMNAKNAKMLNWLPWAAWSWHFEAAAAVPGPASSPPGPPLVVGKKTTWGGESSGWLLAFEPFRWASADRLVGADRSRWMASQAVIILPWGKIAGGSKADGPLLIDWSEAEKRCWWW